MANRWRIRRCPIPIDTSSLDAGASITTAVLKLYCFSASYDDNDAQAYIGVVKTYCASTSALQADDFIDVGCDDGYDQGGRAANTPITQGATPIDLDTLTTSAYNSITLNATGRGWINKGGITPIGIREGHDIEDVSLTDVSGTRNNGGFEVSEDSNDPTLTITYTAGQTYYETISGEMPSPSGSIFKQSQIGLAGAFPAGSGALAKNIQKTLSGAMPASSGDLIKQAQINLDGDMPASSATLATALVVLQTVLGNMPAASGTLKKSISKKLFGNMPAAAGQIYKKFLLTLTGTMGSISGTIKRSISKRLSGDMPPSDGSLGTAWSTSESVTGNMPAASGIWVQLKIL